MKFDKTRELKEELKKESDKHKKNLSKAAKKSSVLTFEFAEKMSDLVHVYAQEIDVCYIIMVLEIMKMHAYSKTHEVSKIKDMKKLMEIQAKLSETNETTPSYIG